MKLSALSTAFHKTDDFLPLHTTVFLFPVFLQSLDGVGRMKLYMMRFVLMAGQFNAVHNLNK